MRRRMFSYLLVFIFTFSFSSFASDLEVSDLTLSSTKWGDQTASFILSNSGDNYKYIVAVSEVRFTDGKYESPRSTKEIYFIEPSSENNLQLPVVISAGYGKIGIDILLYDVVDTLDQLFDSRRFYSKSFEQEFTIPENLKSAIVDEIKLPKFVEDNILFDNYFSRAFLTLIYYGKTTDEIAELCGTDTEFIKTVLTDYQNAGLITIDGSSAALNFMAINKNLAEAIIPVVDKTVENLFETVTGNFHGYDSAIKDLVSQGKLSADKFDALDLGTILYEKYPVTFGLLLWDILGREFVNDGKPFNIFADSDPCNAEMGDFMYMMIGAKNYTGDSYFYSTLDPNNDVIYCGFGLHNFKCPPNYRELAKRKRHVVFEFDITNPDKVYLYNSNRVIEPLSILMDGTIEHADNLKTELDKIFAGTLYDTNNRGTRYWCWDLVVTRLMKKFEDENILETDGIKLYRLQNTSF